MTDCRYQYIRNEIMFETIYTKLILEEIAKLPRTTDTSHIAPDVVELVDGRFWDFE